MLRVKQIELRQANLFVEKNHRHHKKVVQHRFSLGCYRNDELVGIAIVGNPIAREYNSKRLEVSRLCSLGEKNVVSKLLSACAKIVNILGYEAVQTYILKTETGISLKASGWVFEADCEGETLSKSKNRGRQNFKEDLFGTIKKYPDGEKQRWIKQFIK